MLNRRAFLKAALLDPAFASILVAKGSKAAVRYANTQNDYDAWFRYSGNLYYFSPRFSTVLMGITA